MKSVIHKLLFEPTDNGLLQMLRYCFVGGIAALANIASLFVFTDIIGWYYLASNVLAFTIGLIVNFTICKIFVFKQDIGNKLFEFFMYAVIGIIGLFFDTSLLWFFTEIFGFHYMFSKICSTIIVLFWNFGARKMMYFIYATKIGNDNNK